MLRPTTPPKALWCINTWFADSPLDFHIQQQSAIKSLLFLRLSIVKIFLKASVHPTNATYLRNRYPYSKEAWQREPSQASILTLTSLVTNWRPLPPFSKFTISLAWNVNIIKQVESRDMTQVYKKQKEKLSKKKKKSIILFSNQCVEHKICNT